MTCSLPDLWSGRRVMVCFFQGQTKRLGCFFMRSFFVWSAEDELSVGSLWMLGCFLIQFSFQEVWSSEAQAWLQEASEFGCVLPSLHGTHQKVPSKISPCKSTGPFPERGVFPPPPRKRNKLTNSQNNKKHGIGSP